MLVIGFVRLVFGLGQDSLWWDEAISVHRASHSIPYILTGQIVIDGVVTYDQHPPLYFILLHSWMQVAGQSEFALRFPSVMASLLVAPLVYVLGRRLIQAKAALLAGALTALSPFLLWQAREVRMYPLLTLTGCLAVYATMQLLTANQRSRLLWGGVWLVANIAMMLTQYIGLFLLIFEIGLLAIYQLRRSRQRRLLVSVIILLLALVILPTLALPWWWQSASVYIKSASIYIDGQHIVNELKRTSPDLYKLLLTGLNLGVSVNADSVTWLNFILTAIALLGVIGIIWDLITRRKLGAGGGTSDVGVPLPSGAFLAVLGITGYVALPLLGIQLAAIISGLNFYVRYALMVTPGYYLALAVGLIRAGHSCAAVLSLGRSSSSGGKTYSRPGLRFLMLFLPLILLLLGLGGAWGYVTYQYFTAMEFHRDDHKGWGQVLRQEGQGGDLVVLDGSEIFILNDFYGNPSLPTLGLPRYAANADSRTETELARVSANYRRVWLVQAYTWRDPQGLVQRWLDEHAFKIAETGYPSFITRIRLSLYLMRQPVQTELPADLPPSPFPVLLDNGLNLVAHFLKPVQFAGQIASQGQVLNSSTPVEAGEWLSPQFAWQIFPTHTLPIKDVYFALRLQDTANQVWNQIAGPPFDNRLPVSQWPAGKYVLQDLKFQVPPGTPAGKYRLMLSVYASDTGVPVNVLDTSSNPMGVFIPLETFDVVRPSQIKPLADIQPLAYLGDGLELVEAKKDKDTARPGETLTVFFTVGATRPRQNPLEVRVELVDGQGSVQLQKNLLLGELDRTGKTWRAGEVLSGQVELTIPAGKGGAHEDAQVIELAFSDPADNTGDSKVTSTPLSVQVGWWPFHRTAAYILGSLTIPPTGRSFELPADLTPPLHQGVSRVEAGGVMELVGYGLPQSLESAKPFPVILYWRGLVPIPGSYKVSVQLLNASEHLVTQQDAIPGKWTRPTTGWLPGEVITDSYTLDIPASLSPGDYTLLVIVYHESDGMRLPIQQFQGQLADTITITTLHLNILRK